MNNVLNKKNVILFLLDIKLVGIFNFWIMSQLVSVSLGLLGLVLSSSEVLSLLLVGLESSVSQLGSSIDELEVNFFQSGSVSLGD